MLPTVAEQGWTLDDYHKYMASPERQSQLWDVPRLWDGLKCFVIGGGPSLVGFDWGPVSPLNVIGCNDAYKLGQWVDICLYGDIPWAREHMDGLQALTVHTNGSTQFVSCTNNLEAEYPHVRKLERKRDGLVTEPCGQVAWNESTGAAAINLAVLLGTTTIVLLGFDGKLDVDGAANWYTNRIDPPNPEDYVKFNKGFEVLALELMVHCPHVCVVNAGPDSVLEAFPHMTFDEALAL